MGSLDPRQQGKEEKPPTTICKSQAGLRPQVGPWLAGGLRSAVRFPLYSRVC